MGTQKHTGELYKQSHFSGMTKVYARLQNHFLYLFNTPAADVPSMAFFLDKATVQMWAIEQAFEIEFPTRRTRSTSASRCSSPRRTIRRSTPRRKPTARAGRRRSRRPRACGASATSTTSARRSARDVSPRCTA